MNVMASGVANATESSHLLFHPVDNVSSPAYLYPYERGTQVLRVHHAKYFPSRSLHRRYEQPRKRVFEHKHHRLPGFSEKYNAERLVYFEQYSDVRTAIERETQLKKWRREKKEWLITLKNPRWLDLARDWWTAYEASPKT